MESEGVEIILQATIVVAEPYRPCVLNVLKNMLLIQKTYIVPYLLTKV